MSSETPNMETEKVGQSLPRYIGLKSIGNNKYLRYVYEDGEDQGYLKFDSEEVVNPFVKLQVERAKADNGLVHLRSCYKNKYLVRKSDTKSWIVADAAEPEEDTSKWSCTLFEPHFDINGVSNTVALKHVQLQSFTCPWRAVYYDCLYVGGGNPSSDNYFVFSFVDWESLVVFPQHVAFKGDNGKYLAARWVNDNPFLKFNSTDLGDELVGNQVSYTPDGAVRIKNNHFDKFWRRSPNWIWGDSTDTTSNNLDTLFWPVKVGDNVIALRNLYNNNFCKRLTAEHNIDCLNAAVKTITDEAKLEVYDLALSTTIYDVDFRISDARIYDQTPTEMFSRTVENNTNQLVEIDVEVEYKETVTSTWDANVSLELSVKTTFEAGIPLIEKGKITVGFTVSGEYQWGESKVTEKGITDVVKVQVPAMSTTTVKVMATYGTCEIPFSYTQRDVLTNGEIIKYDKVDGIYTGINMYDNNYVIKQQPLPIVSPLSK